LRVRAVARIRSVVRGGRRRADLLPRFPVAFRPPAFASQVTRPSLGDWAFLAVGLPATSPCPDFPSGFPRSTRTRCDRGGCLLYLGGGGAHPADKKSPASACRFPAASPCTPPGTPSARLTHNETSTEVHAIHPSGLPLARDSRMEQGSFGFPSELRTPPLPASTPRVGPSHQAQA
jgi:hypothetical protein